MIMIDTATGQVVYAVLSCGGFLGMGDKLFAIPGRSLGGGKNKQFVLDIDRKELEHAPGFDENNWPERIHRGASTSTGATILVCIGNSPEGDCPGGSV